LKSLENPKWLSIDWPNYVNDEEDEEEKDEEEGENSDDMEEDENDSGNNDGEKNNYDEIKETFSSNDKNDREKSYLKMENKITFEEVTRNYLDFSGILKSLPQTNLTTISITNDNINIR
jgi:hypothetical protein